jgi:hypothetical protein
MTGITVVHKTAIASRLVFTVFFVKEFESGVFLHQSFHLLFFWHDFFYATGRRILVEALCRRNALVRIINLHICGRYRLGSDHQIAVIQRRCAVCCVSLVTSRGGPQCGAPQHEAPGSRRDSNSDVVRKAFDHGVLPCDSAS